jgi:hypothetical protein
MVHNQFGRSLARHVLISIRSNTFSLLSESCDGIQYEISSFLRLAQHWRVAAFDFLHGNVTASVLGRLRHPFLHFGWEGVVIRCCQVPYWYVFPSCVSLARQLSALNMRVNMTHQHKNTRRPP